MTVGELKKELERFPDEMEVMSFVEAGDYPGYNKEIFEVRQVPKEKPNMLSIRRDDTPICLIW